MKNISNELLAILSLLTVIGFLVIIAYGHDHPMTILGYLSIIIGGLSFGVYVGRSRQ